MKIFVTAHFSGEENRLDIEELCDAVREAGQQDFNFIRNIEHYQKIFSNPKELWAHAKTELQDCEALLIDVSDNPSGGRVIETGMAYALDKPIFVIVRRGFKYKALYDGVATEIIHYTDYTDIVPSLRKYLSATS